MSEGPDTQTITISETAAKAWARSPEKNLPAVTYHRADTVVDRVVADELAAVMERGLEYIGNSTSPLVERMRAAVAAYKEATK